MDSELHHPNILSWRTRFKGFNNQSSPGSSKNEFAQRNQLSASEKRVSLDFELNRLLPYGKDR